MKPSAEMVAESVALLEAMGVTPTERCPKCAVDRFVLTWLREPVVADVASYVSECATCGEVLRIEDHPTSLGIPRTTPMIGPTFPMPEEP